MIAGGLGSFEPRKPMIKNLTDFEQKGVNYIVKEPDQYLGKEMVISGLNYSTEDLSKFNFFDDLFDEDDKIKIINKWVKKFKSRSPLASQMIKKSMNVLAFHDALAIMHMDYDQFLLTQNYSDS